MENKPTDKVMSTQKQLQTSHDPGWNDPPKWAYSPTPNSSGGTPTKRLLNKRVAFPLNSTSSTLSNQQSALPINLPPPLPCQTTLTTAPHAPLLAPSTVSIEQSTSELVFDKEKVLIETLENFDFVISCIFKNDSKIDEIQKRLGIMKSMWTDNKLNSEIQKKLFEISQAVHSDDIDAADKIHVSLMMNHGATCSTWISAIRHLILAIKEKKNTEINDESTHKSQPILLLNPADSK